MMRTKVPVLVDVGLKEPDEIATVCVLVTEPVVSARQLCLTASRRAGKERFEASGAKYMKLSLRVAGSLEELTVPGLDESEFLRTQDIALRTDVRLVVHPVETMIDTYPIYTKPNKKKVGGNATSADGEEAEGVSSSRDNGRSPWKDVRLSFVHLVTGKKALSNEEDFIRGMQDAVEEMTKLGFGEKADGAKKIADEARNAGLQAARDNLCNWIKETWPEMRRPRVYKPKEADAAPEKDSAKFDDSKSSGGKKSPNKAGAVEKEEPTASTTNTSKKKQPSASRSSESKPSESTILQANSAVSSKSTSTKPNANASSSSNSEETRNVLHKLITDSSIWQKPVQIKKGLDKLKELLMDKKVKQKLDVALSDIGKQAQIDPSLKRRVLKDLDSHYETLFGESVSKQMEEVNDEDDDEGNENRTHHEDEDDDEHDNNAHPVLRLQAANPSNQTSRVASPLRGHVQHGDEDDDEHNDDENGEEEEEQEHDRKFGKVSDEDEDDDEDAFDKAAKRSIELSKGAKRSAQKASIGVPKSGNKSMRPSGW